MVGLRRAVRLGGGGGDDGAATERASGVGVEPVVDAVDVEDVLAGRHLEQLLFHFELSQAHATPVVIFMVREETLRQLCSNKEKEKFLCEPGANC